MGRDFLEYPAKDYYTRFLNRNVSQNSQITNQRNTEAKKHWSAYWNVTTP